MVYQLGGKVKYFYMRRDNKAAFSGTLACIDKPFPMLHHKHLQNLFIHSHGKRISNLNHSEENKCI